MAKRKASWAFDRLSNREVDTLLSQCTDYIRHEFSGYHALGGVRSSKEDFRYWSARLFKLFFSPTFKPHDVLVEGPPWNMRLAVTWTDRGQAADGVSYRNNGVHTMRFRWNKMQFLHADFDTQHLVIHLDRMARNGIEEAHAEPIGARA